MRSFPLPRKRRTGPSVTNGAVAIAVKLPRLRRRQPQRRPLPLPRRLRPRQAFRAIAVDLAVSALLERGCAAGWVNAGGDLRAFGDVEVPVLLRDEITGGVRRFATLQQGAFATSHFDRGSRATLTHRRRAHVSVAAPQCLWADALTKIVAIRGDTADPLLARYQATAWRH